MIIDKEDIRTISDTLSDLGESVTKVDFEKLDTNSFDINKIDTEKLDLEKVNPNIDIDTGKIDIQDKLTNVNLDAKPTKLELGSKVDRDVINPKDKAVIEPETKAKKAQESNKVTSDNIIKPSIEALPILKRASDFYKNFFKEIFFELGDKLQTIFYIIAGIVVLYIVHKVYIIFKALKKLGAKLRVQIILS